jgi:hypothetical protein
VDGVNVYELLDSCHDLFNDFGGHEGAAGFEIDTDNIPELRRRLAAEAEQKIDPADLVGGIAIDAAFERGQQLRGELDLIQDQRSGKIIQEQVRIASGAVEILEGIEGDCPQARQGVGEERAFAHLARAGDQNHFKIPGESSQAGFDLARAVKHFEV